MAVPSNILQQVQRYLDPSLAYLQNFACFISTANKKFQNFQNEVGQLGTTVNIELPYRFISNNGLVVNFEPTEQRFHPLTTDQSANVPTAFTAQQFIYNVEEYMEKIGKGAVEEFASRVEINVGLNAKTHTYRFYGDGTTAINSYGQLATMLSNYRDIGCPKGKKLKVYLPQSKVPAIVNSGLSQFVIDRNEKSAMSWMVGDYDDAMFYRTNLLPIHTAGTVGNSAQTLTVISTNDPTGLAITQITCSGATASDPDAVKNYDLAQFKDGVSGQANVRFVTFIGHNPSEQPVQFRITADAAADGSGHVVLNVFPALVAQPVANQNITRNIVAGMQITVVPSHRCGWIVGGDAFYLAMPTMPEEVPFPTASKIDKDTGAAIRMYYGSKFGENQRGLVHDGVWGSTAVDEYMMRICFPL